MTDTVTTVHKFNLPLQFSPAISSLKPFVQLHVKDPTVFVQIPLLHGSLSHSFVSEKQTIHKYFIPIL